MQPAGVLTPAEILEGRTRFEAVAGLYQNTRQDDDLWFAFRRPADWALLDAPTRSNGGLYIERAGVRKGLLLVDGAVAVEAAQHEPGYRRLHAMVQHGMTWPRPPSSTATTVREGREALVCSWYAEVDGEAIFDLATGLLVRTEWPGEVVELTDLRFDTQVDQTVFEPPDRTINGWRGGVAFIVRSDRSSEIASSWEPRSGPADLHIPGPKTTSFDAGMRWARERTDEIHVSDEHERP
ncbi:MAG: hypothetical protein LC792_20875 [Actinobacteria bacterium]|nr:hypothetical protein [Actinomycetota bacterium]